MCYFEKFHERHYRGPVAPHIVPGRHKVMRAGGQDGAEGGTLLLFLPELRQQIMLSPSSVASYSIEVIWGYRRAFVVGG